MIVHTINLADVKKAENQAKQELDQVCESSLTSYYSIMYQPSSLMELGQYLKAHITVGVKPVFVDEEFERQRIKFQMAIDNAYSSKPATPEELEKQEVAIEKAVARARAAVNEKPATREELEKQKSAFEKAVAHSKWKLEADRITTDDNNVNLVLRLTVVHMLGDTPVH